VLGPEQSAEWKRLMKLLSFTKKSFLDADDNYPLLALFCPELFLAMENHSGGGAMVARGLWLVLSTRVPPGQWAGITHKYLVISYVSRILLYGLKHVTIYILNYI